MAVPTAFTAAAELPFVVRERLVVASFCMLLLLAVLWPAPVVVLNELTIASDLSIGYGSFLGREAAVWDVVFWSIAGLWLIALFHGRTQHASRGFGLYFRELSAMLRRVPGVVRRSWKFGLTVLASSVVLVALTLRFVDVPATAAAERVAEPAIAVVLLLNRLGGGMNPLMVLGFFVFAGVALQNGRWLRTGAAIAAAGVSSAVVVHVLKWATSRVRPELWTGVLDFSETSGGSFPSGHTASGFAIAAVIGATSRSLPVRITAFLLAAAIAAARVVAFRHWASDVVAASAVGIGFGLLYAASLRAAPAPLE